MPYLVEIEGNKEDETVNRLFAKNWRIPIEKSIQNHFEVNLPFSVVGLRIPFNYIDETLEKLEGDIDIFFIQLSSNVQDYFQPLDIDLKNSSITAFEVKTGYLNSEKKLKSLNLFPGREESGSYSDKQFKFRHQAEKLCKLGFDKVALMYTIPIAPQTENYLGFQSWNIASNAISEVDKIVEPLIYVDEKKDEFSTFYYPIGTIPDREEHKSGVLEDFKFKFKRKSNPIENLSFQKKLKSKIENEFPYKINPNKLPILFLACSKNSCKNVYLSSSDPYKNCPKCGSKPICKYFS